MTDWRGLCAELVAAWDSYGSGGDAWDRARAALAQPEPEAPTDDELDIAVIAIQRLAPYQPDGPTQPTHDIYAVERGREILKLHLAQWGRPASALVPIAERLPGPEDCDEKGRCWAWNPEAFWWDLCQLKFIKMNAGDPFTHWLPHWALSVPTPHLKTETPPPSPPCP